MALFSIDGKQFNIPFVDVKREAPFLDKYATRTENGDLQREIIGVYYNYTLSFPNLILDREEYSELWDILTEPKEFHSFVVPGSSGTYSFTGYVSSVSDQLIRQHNGNNYWGGLSVKLIAKSPARS